jgi:5-methylthioadenosine/S-adenosylhomocysteine deaminase
MSNPDIAIINVIIVDLDKPHCLPVYDETAALVYSARADDVVTTICDGRILMEERVLPGIDEAEIRHRFRKGALALKNRSMN